MLKINGVAYSWAELTCSLDGSIMDGVTEIKYSVKASKGNAYGRGSDPILRKKGQREYSGSIKMHYTQMAALRKLAPDGDITKMPPFEISVTMGRDNNEFITDVLKFVEFEEAGLDSKQGDDAIEFSTALIIGGIEFGK